MKLGRLPCVAMALVGALAFAGGCDNRSGSSGSAQGAKPIIAVIPKGSTHEHWKSVHAGAMKAAQEFGVEVMWKGPVKEDDRNSQIETVENFITRGVQGMVLAPLDDTALVGPVDSAMKQNIPVVIMDSGLKGSNFLCYVGTDNYRGGVIAGEELARLLDGKGKVIMLRYQIGSASTEQREAGFMDAIKKHPDIKVVSENQYGGATKETALQASENLLNTLRGSSTSGLTIDGIYCPNESSTFGMLRALQNLGAAGKVKFVGFDMSVDLVKALDDGLVDGLVVQNPIQMGYLGVKAIVDQRAGKPVEKSTDTGATLVTKKNMHDPAIDALLHPDLKKWLND